MNNVIKNLMSAKGAAPCLFYPVAKEMGIPLQEVLSDSRKQTDVLLRIADAWPVSAVIRMTELWCEAAAFGMPCTMDDMDFHKLGAAVYSDSASLQSAVVPAPVNNTTAPLIEAVRLAAPQLNKPLIVGITGPYTLGSVLNGAGEFMMNAMMEPDVTHAFLEKITAFLIDYALEYKKAGANGVIMAEPSVAMISPDMVEDLSNPYIEKIISAVQDDSFSVIYHNCGAVNSHLKAIATLSAHAFHFGSDVDLNLALHVVASDRLVMGNLDPRRFLTATPDDIEAETRALLTQYAAFENYVCSTGCDLSPSAQLDCVSRFCNTAGSEIDHF